MVNFRGKVVLEDGSPPGRLVAIMRKCDGVAPFREANASAKTGEFFLRLYVTDFGAVFAGRTPFLEVVTCYLEAETPGMISTRINISDRKIASNPQLPNLVLSRKPPDALVDLGHTESVPSAARRQWERSVKALAASNWSEAETALRAVVAAAPGFAPAWSALGASCQNQRKTAEARQALERAVELDPKRLPARLALTEVQIQLRDWPAAARTSQGLIDADPTHVYLEAYLDNAVARFQQKDYDGALERINNLIRLDKHRDLPRAEYVLGVILEAKGELEAAGAHMRAYLDSQPRAKDAEAVKNRLANLGKLPPDLTAEVVAAEVRLAAAAEVPVPGGIKAFSAIARLSPTPAYGDFFLQYCRALTSGNEIASSPTAEAGPAIRVFISSVAGLEALGERDGDRVIVRLSVADDRREKTRRALELMGWQLRESGQGYDLEPGNQAIDGMRQRIPGAFGIDELEMREAIAAGRPFEFEIPIETARLVGGAAWSATLKDRPETSGGPIEIFLADPRFARAYASLAAMDNETAGAVVSAVGLVPLIARYAGLLAQYGSVLSTAGGRVAVPGGAKAEPVWARLAGADVAKPTAFLRALLEKDNGVLLTFFFDLWRSDEAHQQYFTSTAARAEAFYRWYRASCGPGPVRNDRRWQAAILQKLRIGPGGSLELPGGRVAWSTAAGTDEDVLLHLQSLEPVAALAGLEEKRGRPLDRDSASQLARHYKEWRYLFPYFEKLPGLGGSQFQALAAFADTAGAAPPAQRALLMGYWHSLVELIVLASDAGSLTAGRAAEAFGNVCAALNSGDATTKSLGALRALAGGRADLDEAIATRLLRLSGARRTAFDHTKELQRVPNFDGMGDAPQPARLLSALTGTVYAAVLHPAYLLVAEDPQLVSKHNFVPDEAELFADSGLTTGNRPPGSHLTGGFARIDKVAQTLASRTAGSAAPANSGTDLPAPDRPHDPISGPTELFAAPPTETVFHASGRVVEVYATVTDGHGRYIDDLKPDQFRIDVEGRPTRLFAFENQTANVTVALLLDTTGSMTATLPSLKAAAMKLVDQLRPDDSVAVYGFNDRVTEFQPFTQDRVAAKRALTRAHAAGTTALYDALLSVSHELAARQGKKVIIVFTDGDDNNSMLTADTAILRAKGRGIPIYTVVHGEALRHPELVGRLANLAQSTGGASFQIRKLDDIGAAFDRMSADLAHGYLLAFQPPPVAATAWQKIAVGVSGRKGLVIRAREGYFPE